MCKKPKENKLGNPSEIPLRMEINRDRERHRAEMVNTDLWKPRPSIRTTIHVFGKRISSRSKFFTYSYLPVLAHPGEVVQIAENLLGVGHGVLHQGTYQEASLERIIEVSSTNLKKRGRGSRASYKDNLCMPRPHCQALCQDMRRIRDKNSCSSATEVFRHNEM
jgi:hypothetical protein